MDALFKIFDGKVRHLSTEAKTAAAATSESHTDVGWRVGYFLGLAFRQVYGHGLLSLGSQRQCAIRRLQHAVPLLNTSELWKVRIKVANFLEAQARGRKLLMGSTAT